MWVLSNSAFHYISTLSKPKDNQGKYSYMSNQFRRWTLIREDMGLYSSNANLVSFFFILKDGRNQRLCPTYVYMTHFF